MTEAVEQQIQPLASEILSERLQKGSDQLFERELANRHLNNPGYDVALNKWVALLGDYKRACDEQRQLDALLAGMEESE